MLFAWAISVGMAVGFIDDKLISFILQKTVYLAIFAWPIMFKGNGEGNDGNNDEGGDGNNGNNDEGNDRNNDVADGDDE